MHCSPSRLLLLLPAMVVAGVSLATAQSFTTDPAVRLLGNDFSYQRWYDDTVTVPVILTGSGCSATKMSPVFGSYAMASLGDTLYLGLGGKPSSWPAGGVLASFTPSVGVLRRVMTLDEEGVGTVEAANGRIYMPGSDPALGDGWELGNIYVHDTRYRESIKRRTIANGLHAGTLHIDASGAIMTAVHGPTMRLMRSTDDGRTWSVRHETVAGTAILPLPGGGYDTVPNWNNSVFGILGPQSQSARLVATTAAYPNVNLPDYVPSKLRQSTDGGVTWSNLGDTTAYVVHAFLWGGRVVTTNLALDSVIVTTIASGAVARYRLPSAVSGVAAKPMAADSSGFLYYAARNGKILRTKNFTVWDSVTSTRRDSVVSLYYWPHRRWLVFSQTLRGSGSIWRLDLCSLNALPSNTYTAAATPATIPAGGSATLSTTLPNAATDADYTLQWQRSSGGPFSIFVDIPGATSPTLGVQPTSTTTYRARFASYCNTVFSTTATVTVTSDGGGDLGMSRAAAGSTFADIAPAWQTLDAVK